MTSPTSRSNGTNKEDLLPRIRLRGLGDPDAQLVIENIWPHITDEWRGVIAGECAVGEEHWAVEHALQGACLAGHSLPSDVTRAAKRIADELGGHLRKRINYWLDTVGRENPPSA